MKKVIALLFFVALIAVLVGCQPKKTYKIALVTDVGTVTDKSFNQGAWEGVLAFAEEFNVTHQYLQPSDQTTDEYVKSIDQAVKDGAEIIVTPGFFFENAVWISQTKHPEVKFVILDGAPHNIADWDTGETLDGSNFYADPTKGAFNQEDNVLSIMYAEHESGFLAGYAAVKDGMTKLGFMGGKAVPAVVRFGYGYIQGANYAATEMGLANGSIQIKYNYLGGFGPDAAFQAKAASWYQGGTEVIFAAAGGAGGSVFAAANQEGGKSIGVDKDQREESTTIITSAMKELAPSVYEALKMWHEDNWPGGEQLVFDAANEGVKLADDFDRFTTFTKAQYDTLFAKLVNGTVVVDGSIALAPVAFAANYPKVTIDYQE
jgi:basic membrane protein A